MSLLCGGRDPAAAAVQQHGLAVLEAGVQEQVHVGGDVGFADAGRFREAHALGNPHDVARVSRRELGVAAAAEQREHPLASLETGDAWSDVLDDPGRFEPEHRRLAGRRRVVALALDDIGPVHRRRRHADQHLPVRRRAGASTLPIFKTSGPPKPSVSTAFTPRSRCAACPPWAIYILYRRPQRALAKDFAEGTAVFETLKPLPPDAILGIMTLFRADQHPKKIDLSVGVYQDENGQHARARERETRRARDHRRTELEDLRRDRR